MAGPRFMKIRFFAAGWRLVAPRGLKNAGGPPPRSGNFFLLASKAGGVSLSIGIVSRSGFAPSRCNHTYTDYCTVTHTHEYMFELADSCIEFRRQTFLQALLGALSISFGHL